MPHRPQWFRDSKVVVSNAATCGINKDGAEQFKVDRETGERSKEIDDRLYEDALKLQQGKFVSPSLSVCDISEIFKVRVASPTYFDRSTVARFEKFIKAEDFESASLAELEADGLIAVSNGHGSPSLDQRLGDVPYIKVSDLRAGQVNVNPTNLVPRTLAEGFWRGPTSGLQAYDLLSPERASKNIGDFCVLMPGQEDVVLTKEVIVIRATKDAPFDQFYLLWALTLRVVRDQWKRIVLMQTNREDVGDRTFEIRIPLPKSKKAGEKVSEPFRRYYLELEQARTRFSSELAKSNFKHHVFIG